MGFASNRNWFYRWTAFKEPLRSVLVQLDALTRAEVALIEHSPRQLRMRLIEHGMKENRTSLFKWTEEHSSKH